MTTQAEREQALRDYKLTIEYKSLKQNAPGGVYLVPSMEDLRTFYGFILVRKGPYQGAVFKFQLVVPPEYNDRNAWPHITFLNYVYNPHVDPTTWELDLQSAFPVWDPHKHYLVTVLTYLKKIFYTKDFSSATTVVNPEAKELATNQPAEFRRKVQQCVQQCTSDDMLYDNLEGSTAVIKPDKPEYEAFRHLLKSKVQDAPAVSRDSVLRLVKEASKTPSK
jgi:ubiquitin-protein ligase